MEETSLTEGRKRKIKVTKMMDSQIFRMNFQTNSLTVRERINQKKVNMEKKT